MGMVSVDPRTGAPDPAGIAPRPVDIHATMLRSMGLGYEHISNLSPRILEGILRQGTSRSRYPTPGSVVNI
jgi:hypothetical protein